MDAQSVFEAPKTVTICNPALLCDVSAKITAPEVAQLAPSAILGSRILPKHLIDPAACRIDGQVIASGYRPSVQVVFLLLLHGHRILRGLQMKSLGRVWRSHKLQNLPRLDPPIAFIRKQLLQQGVYPLPFALRLQTGFGVITSGPEVEHFDVVTIKGKCAILLPNMLRQVIEVLRQVHLAMRISLKFLESNGLVPDDRQFLAVPPTGNLRKVPPFRVPTRMPA